MAGGRFSMYILRGFRMDCRIKIVREFNRCISDMVFAPAFHSHFPLLRFTTCTSSFAKSPHQHQHQHRCFRVRPIRRPRHVGVPEPPRTAGSTRSPRASAVVAAVPAWGVWAVLIGAAAGGLISNRTPIGAALSPPIVTTLITLLLSNFGLIPSAHPAYTVATKVLVPLAIPLLLFAADLRKVFRDTGRVLPAFIIGTFATAISVVAAFQVFPLSIGGVEQGWKVAAALCARHIGGAVNFVSTADALNIAPEAITVSLAADNIVLSAYFVLLFALARNVNDPNVDRAASSNNSNSNSDIQAEEADTTAIPKNDEAEGNLTRISMEEAGICLTISACICFLGSKAALYIPFPLGVIPTITLIALTLSTVLPSIFGKIAKQGNSIGILFMQIFFAATGASGGSIIKVVTSATQVFAFIILHLAIHLAILLGVGKGIFRLHRAELLVASNANVGGPATALAMAAAKNWQSLLIPALLIGVFGYSIATFVGLGVGHLFLKG